MSLNTQLILAGLGQAGANNSGLAALLQATQSQQPTLAAAPVASSDAVRSTSQLQALLAAAGASNGTPAASPFSNDDLEHTLSNMLAAKGQGPAPAAYAAAQEDVTPLQGMLDEFVQQNSSKFQPEHVAQYLQLSSTGPNITGSNSNSILSELRQLAEQQRQEQELLAQATIQAIHVLQQGGGNNQGTLGAVLGLIQNMQQQTAVAPQPIRAQGADFLSNLLQQRAPPAPIRAPSPSPAPQVVSSSAKAPPAAVPSSTASVSSGALAVPAESPKKRRRGRSGSFPQKIHQMLENLEQQGRQDIASFVRDGTAFCIHRPKEFAKEIMQQYFKMGSYASFQRQLNLYSFTRIAEGPDRGSYYHELFVKGKPLLSTTMKRKENKKPSAAKTTTGKQRKQAPHKMSPSSPTQVLS